MESFLLFFYQTSRRRELLAVSNRAINGFLFPLLQCSEERVMEFLAIESPLSRKFARGTNTSQMGAGNLGIWGYT